MLLVTIPSTIINMLLLLLGININKILIYKLYYLNLILLIFFTFFLLSKFWERSQFQFCLPQTFISLPNKQVFFNKNYFGLNL
jgi:hypothetical protein